VEQDRRDAAATSGWTDAAGDRADRAQDVAAGAGEAVDEPGPERVADREDPPRIYAIEARDRADQGIEEREVAQPPGRVA
jgi:hypothetical protein